MVERTSSNPNVRALLRHFERVGFELAPRFWAPRRTGARDILGFIEGEAAHYPLSRQQWSKAVLVSVAHAACTTPPAGSTPDRESWRHREVSVPYAIDCIGHRDLAPWNIVFDGTRVAGIIDWDFAGPSNRAWDLSYVAHRFVPLSSPRLTQAFGWAAEPDRAARLHLLTDAYGHGITPR